MPEFTQEIASDIGAHSEAILRQTFNVAIEHVRSLAPARENPFKARSRRKVHFYIAYSHDPVATHMIERSRDTGPSDGSDAFTITSEINGELITYVFLLVDRFALDEKGKQRPDAFVRLVTALAHEVYGNVADQLKLKLGEPPIMDAAMRIADEQRAFTASIAFLKRYKRSRLSKIVDAEHLKQAIVREEEALEFWKKQKPQACAPQVFVFGGRSGVRRLR
ncbi:hypothetical protein K2X33_16205 [bacterium]|nr:hypothetical protein [bacterium]